MDLNPVRAGMLTWAPDFPWSSARAHVEGRDPSGLSAMWLWREICPLGDWAGVLSDRAATEDSVKASRAAHGRVALGPRMGS